MMRQYLLKPTHTFKKQLVLENIEIFTVISVDGGFLTYQFFFCIRNKNKGAILRLLSSHIFRLKEC